MIVILGFGFLSTFLVRYGFSGSGFNLLVAVVATQWAVVLKSFESWYYRGWIMLTLRRYSTTFSISSGLVLLGKIMSRKCYVLSFSADLSHCWFFHTVVL